MGGGQFKAFTLIELLAIIVILAIIAVITIPIILNVIDNANKGSAIDSAYGYKDAVEKYYVGRLSEDTSFKFNDNLYIVKPNGNLLETDQINQNYIDVHNIEVEGTKPTGGYFEYSNGTIKSGCLTIDEYKITIENGEMVSSEKGKCPEMSLTSCTSPNYNPSPIEWFDFDEATGTLKGFNNNWDENVKDIVIPCEINNVPVTIINQAFPNTNGLTSVVIPDTVKIIRTSFGGNPLNKLVIGENIERIEYAAFSGGSYSFDTLIFPDNLKVLDDGAFSGMKANKIIFGKNLEIITDGSMMNIQVKELLFNGGNPLTISNGVFGDSKIENLTFGEGLEAVTGYAMRNISSLKKLEFPETAEKVVKIKLVFRKNFSIN